MELQYERENRLHERLNHSLACPFHCLRIKTMLLFSLPIEQFDQRWESIARSFNHISALVDVSPHLCLTAHHFLLQRKEFVQQAKDDVGGESVVAAREKIDAFQNRIEQGQMLSVDEERLDMRLEVVESDRTLISHSIQRILSFQGHGSQCHLLVFESIPKHTHTCLSLLRRSFGWVSADKPNRISLDETIDGSNSSLTFQLKSNEGKFPLEEFGFHAFEDHLFQIVQKDLQRIFTIHGCAHH